MKYNTKVEILADLTTIFHKIVDKDNDLEQIAKMREVYNLAASTLPLARPDFERVEAKLDRMLKIAESPNFKKKFKAKAKKKGITQSDVIQALTSESQIAHPEQAGKGEGRQHKKSKIKLTRKQNGRYNHHDILVQDVKSGQDVGLYTTLAEASDATGLSVWIISKSARGIYKHRVYGDYSFAYIDRNKS